MFDDILSEVTGVCDRTGEHGCGSVLVRTDDAGNFQFQPIVVEVLQAGIRIPEIGVQAGTFVIAVAVGIENGAEIHIADIFIGPALVVVFQFLAVDGSLHDVVHIFLRL